MRIVISPLNASVAPSDRPLAVSPNDAARLIGIGRTKLYAEIKSGSLRSVKIGARRLITIAALEDWLAQSEVISGEA